MSANVVNTLRLRAFTTFLSLSASLALAALIFRVVRSWSGRDYIGDSSFLIVSYITYHFVDVRLLPILALSAAIVTILYWISRRTGKQLLLPNFIVIPVFLLTFLFAAGILFKLVSPVDRLVSATTLSDKDFIALFDLQNPSLSKVRISYENQDYQEAQNRLLDYFQSRFRAHSETVRERVDPKQVLKTANLALEHSFTIKGRTKMFPDNIGWHPELSDDREWTYLLNRTLWFDDLVTASLLTDDRHYTDEFSRQFKDWIAGNPLPLWINERNPAWRLIDTGIRPYSSWIEVFKLLVNSPYVDDETRLLMLKSLHDHAQYLFYFQTSGTNHVLIESRGLLKLANEFPEFKRAGRWREVAIRRLESEIRKQVYPDGGHVELSSDYHVRSLNHFVFPLRQTSGPEAHVAPGYREKVEAMRDFLFYTLKPDLRLPLLNDTNTRDISKKLLSEARTDHRGDLLFIVTQGAEGVPPPVRSRAFEDSGVYVMRSDWTKLAQYLIFDAGPYGGWHGHEDKLSFELSAYGTPMIVDGGAYRYSGDKLYRAYFVSSAAHNTVLIDGRGQSRRFIEANKRPERADEAQRNESNLWFSDEEIDYVSGIYRDGYSDMQNSGSGDPVIDKSVTHRRDIVYIKNDYFVIADTLSGSGTHDVELLFHLPPESLPQIAGESVNIRYPNEATLEILPKGQGQLDIFITAGQRKPIQGWFSSEKYEAVPAPVVAMKFRAKLPTTLYTVLVPSPAAAVTENRFHVNNLAVLDTNCESTKVCLEITSTKSVDRITFPSSDMAGRLSYSKKINSGEPVSFERRVREAGTGDGPHNK